MTKVVTIFLVLVMFSTSACRLNDSSDEKTLVNVEDEFIIGMWENLNPSNRSFRFIIQTISQQECTNVTINFSKEKQGQSLSFSLNDVQYPENCNQGQAPAHANIPFANLEPGTYKVSVYLKETIVNHGTLSVSSVGYQLQMDSEIGLRVADKQLLRIFDQSVWGYISYTNPDHAIAAQSARTEIITGNEAQTYQVGNYGYFSLVSNNGNTNTLIPTEPINDLYESFLIQYDGDLNALKDKLAELRVTYAGQLEFTVTNYTGEPL
ncbi:MAG: hypothetical protein AB8G15_22185 [Saprospiraceae bacterium]